MAAKPTKKPSSSASRKGKPSSSSSAAAATAGGGGARRGGGSSSKKTAAAAAARAHLPAKQQKSKPGQQTATTPRKRKVRTYTDKELKLPAFNGIVPAGVTQNSGKKKGKVFIDDN
ncbi:hypothetical protein DV735_g1618, partial [Chaetothyriales sp. CBS 134920]